MPTTGSVRTLYEDSSHTTAIWPRTSVGAVSDSEGNTVESLLAGKQATLIGTETTGQNIKTINGNSILGSGNLVLGGITYEEV